MGKSYHAHTQKVDEDTIKYTNAINADKSLP